jgi:uncharacterized spore protein YtfJ
MTFLVIKSDGNVQLLEANPKDSTIMESVFESAPDFLEKVKGVFTKKKPDDDSNENDKVPKN